MTERWEERALCATYQFTRGDDPWHPEGNKPDAYDEARSWCRRCPVRTECLEEALIAEGSNSAREGMRGGMTPEERRALARKQGRRSVRGSSAFSITVEEQQHRMDLFNAGWSDIRIAAEFSVSSNAIRQWRLKHGLTSKQAVANVGVRDQREAERCREMAIAAS